MLTKLKGLKFQVCMKCVKKIKNLNKLFVVNVCTFCIKIEERVLDTNAGKQLS
jgi:hypothetical protein